ncbi:PEP/pyruvate-binding domain-containing protein [Nocardia huaxiensis]|uniref:PEP/pyruvate-binding domain-containing protein n=1 Tax=Nocardia huaxiensis TaxID=2755382 RepID=UPI001E4349E1|nr:PEP/pyruvate-binding domain-containing protein [Nocardia huaxiensis]UFS97955.1 hypothetical protein LPY97_08680 [Nocardia huaxiensis]
MTTTNSPLHPGVAVTTDSPTSCPIRVLDGSGAGGELVGGKAAALDRLIGWGFPVPAAVVVTADAYRAVATQPAVAAVLDRLFAGADVPADEIDAAFQRAGLPPEIATRVRAAARQVGAGLPVAVRSTATVEDMDASSFAGQYDSVLDVDATAPDAVESAVLAVFSSLHHAAPRAYRRALGIAERDAAMAALIMPMVPAVRSGVLFTQDPTGPANTVRIETVTGLADVLVSGKRTPHVLRVRDGIVPADAGPEIMPLLTAARELERRAGCPQDVEWAWDGERLWLVQARPITVEANAADPFDTPEAELADRTLTTAGIAEMLPGVLPPLRWEVCAFMVEEALRTMLDGLGSLHGEGMTTPHRLLCRVHGRAALDADATGVASVPGTAQKSGGAGKFHAGPSRLAIFRHRLRARTTRRQARFDAEVVIHATAEIDATAPSLDTLPPEELLRYHAALLDLATRAMAAEITVAADAGAIHAGLRTVLARYTGDGEAHRLADLLAVPATTFTPSPRASMAVPAGPTWQEAQLADATGAVPGDAPAPAAPAATEDTANPDALVDQVLRQLETSARWPKSGLTRWIRVRQVERLGAETAEQLRRREQTKQAILLLGGEIRRVHLEVGGRLAAAGMLTAATDVELLTVAEMRTALRDRQAPPPAVLDRRRRRLRRHEDRDPLPQIFHGRPDTSAPVAVLGRQLTGWAAGSGRFRGVARYLTHADQRIGPDEVLVAVTTDPSWAPLLMRCGAMVIEQGGPLSHAAILAREFGVPAVFNLPGAARALDGRHIEVDGDTGIVTVLEEGPGDALARA